MKIAFNALCCGLGNNGGSKTIVRACEILSAHGNDTCILAKNNKYTITPNNAFICIEPPFSPDIVVNVSVWDVESTMEFDCKKTWWVRGYESWYKGENYFLDSVNRFDTIICNSQALADRIAHSDKRVCMQGIDSYAFSSFQKRVFYKYGIVKNSKHLNKNLPFLDEIFRDVLSDYIIIRGNRMPEVEISKVLSGIEKFIYYSESDGLPNLPIEAAFSGCMLYVNDNDNNACREIFGDTVTYYDGLEDLSSKLFSVKYDPYAVAKCKERVLDTVGNKSDRTRELYKILEDICLN